MPPSREEKILIEKRNPRKVPTYDVQPCFGASLEDWDTQGFFVELSPLAIDPDTLAANNRDIRLQLASLQFYSPKQKTPTHAGYLDVWKESALFYSRGFYSVL